MAAHVYLDDIIIASDDMESHIKDVDDVLQALQPLNVRLSPSKAQIGVSHVVYLGYMVSAAGVQIDPAKVDALRNKPSWGDAWVPGVHDTCFRALRDELCDNVAKQSPDFSREFWIACDASQVAWGAVLFQYRDDGKKTPVHFASGAFNNAQTNYSATERECCAIVNSIEAFRYYFFDNKVNVVTDHKALEQFNTATSKRNDRLFKWTLFLSTYDINVTYLKGSLNVDADYMSRWDNIPDEPPKVDGKVVTVNNLNLDGLDDAPILPPSMQHELHLAGNVKRYSSLRAHMRAMSEGQAHPKTKPATGNSRQRIDTL
eukprot:TRINITY_DN12577_c0_g1_i3.p1 TRINITY_DN12577_c0_g1~~TRINITY_DN12577_c0_g1_i3.p1  ORF type:complete len:355 (-),score=42.71 TRINITY_DN12577_c0_g1_i3:55-1002(-)